MLEIKELTKQFDDFKVLNNVNLSIKDGSIFGLVGVNGAGKSTLLRCISGVYQSDKGSVLFNGKNTYLDSDIRNDIFMVSDDVYFPFASNVNSIVEFYDSFYKIDKTLLYNYLDMFKLKTSKAISSFSKGMKRQLMLIIALAIRPKLLLLDEAFDGLDPLVRYAFKKEFVKMIDEDNCSIIISSHNLKELEDICDSYCILENAQINTYGDLLESKAEINKYQLAFEKDFDIKVLDDFKILHSNKQGSVLTLVIKGDKEEIISKLKTFNPLILDTLPVNFEELFIYEHEGGLN